MAVYYGNVKGRQYPPNKAYEPEPETKTCAQCGIEKPVGEFYRDRTNGTIRRRCKECERESSLKRWHKRKEVD